MKKLMLLSAILLNGVMISFATKLTVDNTPGSAANYSAIPAAVSNATAGDTILVYGSSYSYGGVSIDRKLTLVGSAGFDPQVSNESTPTLTNITFSNGSSGSTFSGFFTGTIQIEGTNTNDLGIYNNRITGNYGILFYYTTSSNIVVEGNVFQSNSAYSFIENYASGSSTLNNILVKNNYFEMQSYAYYGFQHNNSAFTYRNNVFIARSCCGYNFFNACSNVLLENNIFWFTDGSYTDISGQQCTNCVFNNNIIYNGAGTMTAINTLGNGVSGSNNILNTDPQFLNFDPANNYTIAENYKIQDASLGNNAGTDASDIGLYGGNYNWENRKYPKAFPHQEVLNVINSSVPQGTPVNINLKARKAGN